MTTDKQHSELLASLMLASSGLPGMDVIWIKTDAGIAELTSHLLITSAATQNLLRAIDGVKSEEMLLKHLIGVTVEDLRTLVRLSLIEPLRASPSLPGTAVQQTVRTASFLSGSALAAQKIGKSKLLSRLASTHLGLAGMAVTTSISKATTVEELRELGRHLVDQIRVARGDKAAAKAGEDLFGLL